MRISLASRPWLNSRKLGIPSTSHNSHRHSSTTHNVSSACVDDSGIRDCSGPVSLSRWFKSVSPGASAKQPKAPDTPNTGTRERRTSRARMRPVSSGTRGTASMESDPSADVRPVYASAAQRCVVALASPSGAAASSPFVGPRKEHAISADLAVVPDRSRGCRRPSAARWSTRSHRRVDSGRSSHRCYGVRPDRRCVDPA